MGCWNATCGLSQLPIHSGDKVKLVLLEKSSTYQRQQANKGCGFSYPDSLFSPSCIPITGHYNDYGSIEGILDSENIFYNFLIKLLELRKIEHKVENIEELIEEISRGNLEDISFVLIHEDLYTEVCEIVSSEESYFSNTTLSKTYSDFLDDYFNAKTSMEIFIAQGDPSAKLIPSEFKRFVSIEDLKSLKEEILNFLLFETVLSKSRKFWSPQSGAGSQDTDYEIAKLLGQYAVHKEEQRNIYLNS